MRPDEVLEEALDPLACSSGSVSTAASWSGARRGPRGDEGTLGAGEVREVERPLLSAPEGIGNEGERRPPQDAASTSALVLIPKTPSAW